MDGVKMFLKSCIRSQFTHLMVFPVSVQCIFWRFWYNYCDKQTNLDCQRITSPLGQEAGSRISPFVLAVCNTLFVRYISVSFSFTCKSTNLKKIQIYSAGQVVENIAYNKLTNTWRWFGLLLQVCWLVRC